MREAVVALAHKIKLNEANWQRKYVTSLIETAFLYKDNHSFSNFTALQEFLRTEGILPFKIFHHEWESGVSSLLSNESVVKLHTGGWRMTESKISNLQREVNEWIGLEEKVKKDWLCKINGKYPALSEHEKDLLWQNLKEKFILKLFLRHGAETVKVIFGHAVPDEEKFSASVYEVLKESTDNMSDQLYRVAEKEFSLFFDPSDDNRRRYLIGILDATFSHLAITLPEESISHICRTSSLELILFLDTNFLFSILGLHEHHLNEAAKEIFSQIETLSRISGGRAKIKFCCAKDTLGEFKSAIDRFVTRLKDINLSSPVAKAALSSEYFQSVDMAYFKKCAETNIRISPEQFSLPYTKGTETLLKSKGIILYNEETLTETKNSQEVIDDAHDFKDYLESRGRNRSWDTINNDVVLWHLVKKRRELTTTSKYYIITCDYRFLAFDRYKFQGSAENLICLLPTQLLQMLSLLVPRTTNLEKALITFIKTPMAKHIGSEMENVSLKILGAVAIYKDFSEEVATELLTDEAFRNIIKDAGTTEEVRKLIEDKLSKDLEIERREREKAKIELHEKGKALLQKDTKISDLEANLEEKSKKIQEYEKQLEEIKETNMKMKEQLEKSGKPQIEMETMKIKEQLKQLEKSQIEMETREKVRKEWWDWFTKLLPWKK